MPSTRVSDALIAETVHQVVRGNPLRAASTVDSIAGGDAPPPRARRRSHAAHGYRADAPPGRRSSAAIRRYRRDGRRRLIPQRADVEPRLNAWAARLLGNPANVRCFVERPESGHGRVAETKSFV